MTPPSADLPTNAYRTDGEPLWSPLPLPGGKRRLGDEPRIAAWLAFTHGVGGVFTMRELRRALGGDAAPNDAEHLNRRLRNLRTKWDWQIDSARDDGSLRTDQYRVVTVGWYPGSPQPKPVNDAPSDKTRRLVFERDQHTCVVCGATAGEPYDDLPDRRVRMTLGHRTPGARLTRAATVDDLQAECSRCNEVVRDQVFDPVTLPQILPMVRALSRRDKQSLLDWLRSGARAKSDAERAYQFARRLSASEQDRLRDVLETTLPPGD